MLDGRRWSRIASITLGSVIQRQGRTTNALGMKAAAAVLLLLCSSAWAQLHEIPDHNRTPGTINSAVTQDNIFSTVCVPNWTRTKRPPQSYIEHLKRKQMRELRQPGDSRDYHEDHIVPLCVGGPSERPSKPMATTIAKSVGRRRQEPA
jgi:hypothetical protein